MATILYVSKYGSADPTEASMPFHFAVGAIDAGHEPQIALAGEATNLIKDEIIAQIHGMGIPPLKELMQKVIEHSVPIAIWGGCAKARGVTEADLKGKNAEFVTPKIFAEAVVAADRVVSV